MQRWRGNDLMAFVVSAGPMHAYVGSAAGTGLERLGACAEASEGTDCARDDAGSFRLRGAELASWSAAGAACARRCGECTRCRFFSFSVRWRDCSWYAACPTGPLTFMTRDFRTRRAANKTGAWGVGEGVDARRAAMHDIALAFGGMIGGFTGKSVFGHKDDVRVLQLTALAWRHALPSATVYLHSWSVELRDDIERELQPALSEYESPWVGSKPPHGCAAERASFASQATSRLRALQLATRNRQHALVVSTRFDVLPCQREPLLLPVQPMLIHAGALSWFRPFPRLDDSLLSAMAFFSVRSLRAPCSSGPMQAAPRRATCTTRWVKRCLDPRFLISEALLLPQRPSCHGDARWFARSFRSALPRTSRRPCASSPAARSARGTGPATSLDGQGRLSSRLAAAGRAPKPGCHHCVPCRPYVSSTTPQEQPST